MSNTNLVDQSIVRKKLPTRLMKNKVIKSVFLICTLIGLVVLAILLFDIFRKGMTHLNVDFFTNFSSTTPSSAGIKGALIGTLWLMMTIAPISIILGVGTAIYMVEYAKENWFTKFIRVNISNLAGVPSVVFGLLGLTIFVRGAGFENLSLGKSVIAAALTMSLMILPIIIVASQEALKSVPSSIREASLGLGSTKWQTIKNVVLPASIPGILTGTILALSRALGETAPLVVIGIPAILMKTPNSIFDSFQALPMQIYNWAKLPQAEFQLVSSAAIIVLLIILIIMNSIAIYIRNKYQRKL
ncbi:MULTISPECIES: phosphate ABC transporter permease PstA [Mammaliicoccus]|uniref:phosphate ABC transporter permease PstA n=1 Tax=Mammaliicoccus TaxID=2803850 RepID=UPI0007D90D4F|nr:MULTISPECIES: phosphate ABC transporter permease PstA [Mammaliicoccus]HBV03829.1 phosphate ABC transporter permease PtsA [Staphylococcus sp.]MBW0761627.1 phosphate ABC transporter permease PstA [Mammaliicoccus lentus]MBW0766822.1 phosphate ABC transporter permease PstA [Mammaliicoccus lentus]MDQ7141939.1 phosphate ABC transporter permease PstA [Mammaliicoccus lentus]MEB8092067.1 phosphate ABC transporter permease PstA [Mammaliicoccus lentus]